MAELEQNKDTFILIKSQNRSGQLMLLNVEEEQDTLPKS